VQLDRPLRTEHRRVFEEGMILDGTRLLPVKVSVESDNWIELTLFEGKNRQIRRMLEHFDYEVKRLIRTQIGNLTLKNLEPGETRELTAAEVKSFFPI
jgi:pseudouridine synthase